MEQPGYQMDDVFYGIKGSHLSNFRKMMMELTRVNVNNVIKKYLQLKDLKISMVRNKAIEFKKELVVDTPSPTKYTTLKSDEVSKEDKLIEKYSLPISGCYAL